MTLQEIKTLHAYNAWATNLIIAALERLSPDQYNQDMKGSHGSIHATFVHLVGGEKIWRERFQGNPQPFLSAQAHPTLGDVKAIWESNGYDIAKWIGTMSDKSMLETFSFKTAKGDTFTYKYVQAFQHIVNHSSYHRGQIVTMLRQLGVKPPTTDLTLFFRETGQAG
jgi:uncharacterized damage-inducible protein DinB